MSQLWKKDYEADNRIMRFTVGSDYELDKKLFYADVMASIAHVRGLAYSGVIAKTDAERLTHVLQDIWQHKPDIRMQDEDCHTWIEQKLVSRLGDLGKRIHTGRSRNDQVLAAARVYTREKTLDLLEKCISLLQLLFSRAKEHENTPFPGRTHTLVAMPFSIGMLFDAWFEQYLDDITLLHTAYEKNNRSPLGSAAGYGVPVSLDREYVAKLLGFSGVQTNVLAVQNSRARIESVVLQALDHIMITSARIAQELILYSLPEFNYVSIPKSLCTGSSIMPQKHNPDVLELIRASVHTVHSLADRVTMLPIGLISGYHRDMQITKQACMEAFDAAESTLDMMILVIKELEINNEGLAKSLPPEIFATDAVFSKIEEGETFRDAYREIAKDPKRYGETVSFEDSRKLRTSTGTHGNPPWTLRMKQIDDMIIHDLQIRKEHKKACQEILHHDSIFPDELIS